MKTNTDPIWNLRDEIVDARIEAADFENDVDNRHFLLCDLQEQIDLLGNMAEAIEDAAAVSDDEMDHLHGIVYCQVMAENALDPRTIWERAADEQDEQHSQMITELRQF